MTLIVRGEKVATAERCHPSHAGTGQPVDDVDIMTALFQKMRSRVFRSAAPVAHDVAAMIEFQCFIEFQAYNVADDAAANDLF